MSTIVTRSGKGAALTHTEVDANFTNLNADKAEASAVILATQKGAASGVCPLDATSKVASTYLPSYVDDVLEYANYAGLPVTGETGKIYIALDTNKTYRWSGSAYIYITSGAVDSVAGKTGVVTLTSADVGLGSANNTSDTSKPISTATQTALDLKAPLANPTLSNPTYTGTLTGGTGILNIGSGQVYKDASGKVGINVTPAAGTNAKMQITGLATNATTLATAYSDASLVVVPKSTSGYSLAIASGTGDSPQLQVSANGAASGDLLIQPYGGNVGIGTSSPTQKLHVAGNVFAAAGVTLGAAGGEGGEIAFQSISGTSAGMIDVDGGNAWRFYNSLATPTIFFTGSTERLRLTAAGGVSFGSSGTAYGTSGQVLTSAGDAAPVWTNQSSIAAGTASNITAYTINQNVGTANAVQHSDITTARAADLTTGYMYYGNTGTKYAGFDGTNFVSSMPMNFNILGSSGSCTGNAATATKASTLAQNGGAGAEMTFNWAGQGGQPSWLWGGNDGANHYVYNPSNFNVNYATYAGIRGTAAIAASGTSVTFSAIPAGVKRIVLVCNAIGVTALIPPVIRIGAATILATGYVGSTWYHNTTGISGAAITVGFDMINTIAAASNYCGIYILTKYAGNDTWMCTGSVGATVGGLGGGVHGQSPNLGAALTQVSIQMPTTAFDGGAFSIYYE